ncbi:NAD(P)H-dependent oxidoreductase [Lacticaseibacillus songhuajiangensis]|uniref:NAD(P)H-dependent oxidoreductase n=1 Tax=Lacticaseibacillus songhuajiangensis TaxID=1296539 RepID=UPI000F7AC95A|nr:NAD(P)H-dependent oxidoreductase [Lacticaseibacillus songhuajiangensis]
MTDTLIIYCHPYAKSFNHAILSAVVQSLRDSESSYRVLDLYADHFNPAYDEHELALYASGATSDSLVTDYLSVLKSAERMVIITPIWWNDIPAMLKGFFDKVMKRGPEFAYTPTRRGIAGNLGNIQSTLILTTSTSPTFFLRLFCGDAIQRVMIGGTLKQLGIKHVKWHNLGGITSSTSDQRAAHLSKIEGWVKMMR